MAEAGGKADKLKVFISYSRDDLKFADQLDTALELTGFEALLDRQGISGAEDWRKRLGDLIRDADTVVFVLSPSSARSDVCGWEVEEAQRLNKRIVPVLCRALEGASPPRLLQALNYIYFYDEPASPGSGFGAGLSRLVTTLNTDLGWVREHTRLLARAAEWEASGRAENRLLFGSVIADAKAWAASRPKDAPEPTALHFDYIRVSEETEAGRRDAARLQMEERAKALSEREEAVAKAVRAQRLRNVVLAGMTLAAALAGLQWRRAEAQKVAAELQRTRAETHLIMAREMTSMAVFHGAQRIVRSDAKSPQDLRQIDFMMFREADGPFVEQATRLVDELSDKSKLKQSIDAMDGSLESVAANEASFFFLMRGAIRMLMGDGALSKGDPSEAARQYNEAIELLTKSHETGREFFENRTLAYAQAYGRLASARTAQGDSAAAREAYSKGDAILGDALKMPAAGPAIAEERAWFAERLAAGNPSSNAPPSAPQP